MQHRINLHGGTALQALLTREDHLQCMFLFLQFMGVEIRTFVSSCVLTNRVAIRRSQKRVSLLSPPSLSKPFLPGIFFSASSSLCLHCSSPFSHQIFGTSLELYPCISQYSLLTVQVANSCQVNHRAHGTNLFREATNSQENQEHKDFIPPGVFKASWIKCAAEKKNWLISKLGRSWAGTP